MSQMASPAKWHPLTPDPFTLTLTCARAVKYGFKGSTDNPQKNPLSLFVLPPLQNLFLFMRRWQTSKTCNQCEIHQRRLGKSRRLEQSFFKAQTFTPLARTGSPLLTLQCPPHKQLLLCSFCSGPEEVLNSLCLIRCRS